MKIITIVGARPQFIKAAVVSRVFKTVSGVQEVIVHTGQHYDHNLSDVFFEEMDIPRPDYQLAVGSGKHGAQTGAMLAKIEEVIGEEKPDYMLVYGDTNSTLAGALAAAKLHLPIAHVEAGLRSFNRLMPEEVNRVLTDHMSELLFAPTLLAANNLKREGFDPGSIHRVGDVMYDAALHYRQKTSGSLAGLGLADLDGQDYVLLTLHRAENTDDHERFGNIITGIVQAASQRTVVWPIHPRSRGLLSELGLLKQVEDVVRVIEPAGYLDMLSLESSASLIVTDSGGVQKEAFFHSVPCVTLRDETEWVELVESGWNRLIPPISVEVVMAAILDQSAANESSGYPYGDGTAGQKIVDILL